MNDNEPAHEPEPTLEPAPEGIEQAPAPELATAALFPDGHFYSPVVDRADMQTRADALWPERMPYMHGLRFNPRRQRKVLTHWFPRFLPDYDYPEQETDDPNQFYTQNSQFSWLDARALFVLLRQWRPRRIIEVGSGFSSLLMADVKQRFLGDACHISCIEPYPRPFLLNGVPGIDALIQQRVEHVPTAVFKSLKAGDILFIDSSHVSKTGSDVNTLFFEVLPLLRPGVRVHIHDIFLPDEYPREWVIEQNRSWNEQYLLRALLMDTRAFRILFASNYACRRFPVEAGKALGRPGAPYGGGSFWIERCGSLRSYWLPRLRRWLARVIRRV